MSASGSPLVTGLVPDAPAGAGGVRKRVDRFHPGQGRFPDALDLLELSLRQRRVVGVQPEVGQGRAGTVQVPRRAYGRVQGRGSARSQHPVVSTGCAARVCG